MDDSFNSGQSKIRKTTATRKRVRLIMDKAVLLLALDEAGAEEELLDCIILFFY
jgi:hypothetical protein